MDPIRNWSSETELLYSDQISKFNQDRDQFFNLIENTMQENAKGNIWYRRDANFRGKFYRLLIELYKNPEFINPDKERYLAKVITTCPMALFWEKEHDSHYDLSVKAAKITEKFFKLAAPSYLHMVVNSPDKSSDFNTLNNDLKSIILNLMVELEKPSYINALFLKPLTFIEVKEQHKKLEWDRELSEWTMPKMDDSSNAIATTAPSFASGVVKMAQKTGQTFKAYLLG